MTRPCFPNLPRSGATAVEMVVYLLIFGLLLTGSLAYFQWARNAQSGMKRLDVLHQLRISCYQVAEEISFGSHILFPPVGLDRPCRQVAFKNNANEIVVVYVNEKGQLMLYNVMKKSRGKPYQKMLTGNAIDFSVTRPANHYVEFELTIADESGKTFQLANSARLRNTLK